MRQGFHYFDQKIRSIDQGKQAEEEGKRLEIVQESTAILQETMNLQGTLNSLEKTTKNPHLEILDQNGVDGDLELT